jgi:hypothetical protein
MILAPPCASEFPQPILQVTKNTSSAARWFLAESAPRARALLHLHLLHLLELEGHLQETNAQGARSKEWFLHYAFAFRLQSWVQ